MYLYILWKEKAIEFIKIIIVQEDLCMTIYTYHCTGLSRVFALCLALLFYHNLEKVALLTLGSEQSETVLRLHTLQNTVGWYIFVQNTDRQ